MLGMHSNLLSQPSLMTCDVTSTNLNSNSRIYNEEQNPETLARDKTAAKSTMGFKKSTKSKTRFDAESNCGLKYERRSD